MFPSIALFVLVLIGKSSLAENFKFSYMSSTDFASCTVKVSPLPIWAENSQYVLINPSPVLVWS